MDLLREDELSTIPVGRLLKETRHVVIRAVDFSVPKAELQNPDLNVSSQVGALSRVLGLRSNVIFFLLSSA